MAGFNWNEFYAVFEFKMKKAVKCKVGRYVTPKTADFPYCDVSLGDNSGGNYDLEGKENTQKPLIVITVYATGSLADSTCENISQKAKEIMLSYGFQCRGGPLPVTNVADPSIARWVSRYQRKFGNDDKLIQIN